jgi:hypothetical protein
MGMKRGPSPLPGRASALATELATSKEEASALRTELARLREQTQRLFVELAEAMTLNQQLEKDKQQLMREARLRAQ